MSITTWTVYHLLLLNELSITEWTVYYWINDSVTDSYLLDRRLFWLMKKYNWLIRHQIAKFEICHMCNICFSMTPDTSRYAFIILTDISPYPRTYCAFLWVLISEFINCYIKRTLSPASQWPSKQMLFCSKNFKGLTKIDSFIFCIFSSTIEWNVPPRRD